MLNVITRIIIKTKLNPFRYYKPKHVLHLFQFLKNSFSLYFLSLETQNKHEALSRSWFHSSQRFSSESFPIQIFNRSIFIFSLYINHRSHRFQFFSSLRLTFLFVRYDVVGRNKFIIAVAPLRY
jgi:hypothetical protein